jgi:FkbM family methyltransferase
MTRTEIEPPFGTYAPTALQSAVIGLARSTFLHRGDFRPAVGALLTALRAGPIDVEREGGRFRLHHADNLIEIGLLLHPTYNQREIGFLAETRDEGVFLDIGANIGLYTVAVARLGAEVIAVEPGDVVLPRLHANIAASDVGERVTVAEVAISDRSMTGGLTYKYGDRAIARFEEGIEGGMVTKTLLDLLKELKVEKIGAIKIDIEGREAEALGPFFRQAPKSQWPRRIVIEHLTEPEWGADLFGQLREAGYVETGRTRQNSLLELK